MSRVLSETGFPKLALIAHSQGTTETFVALAKEQRPEIGEKISVFCALAPAAYAGPLIGKIYFRVMRLITPSMFRLVFGIHAFIPLMLLAHKIMPPKPFSWMGYHVFSFLFNWSDSRWDRGLRDRMFQWAPVYVSAESMRWWLGRECFARHKCILATREEGRLEDKEDEEVSQERIRSLVKPFILTMLSTGRRSHKEILHRPRTTRPRTPQTPTQPDLLSLPTPYPPTPRLHTRQIRLVRQAIPASSTLGLRRRRPR